jgi:hypothetical protein
MKKYKSLKDIYLEKSLGKNVPSIPSTRITLVPEKGTVLLQKDPPSGDVEEYNVGDDKLKKVKTILSKSEEKETSIVSLLNGLNIPPAHSKIIAEKVFESEANEKIVAYLNNRDVRIEDLDGKNIIDVFTSKVSDRTFVEWLLSYEWAATPNVGAGEAFISIMVAGARKTSTKEKGDVKIGEQELEIKGDGARLRGQKGFGSAIEAGNQWSRFLKENVNKYNLGIDVPAGGNNVYNFVKNGYAFDTIGQQIIANSGGKFTLNDLLKGWKDGLLKLYLNANEDNFNFIDASYENGVLNKEKFNNGLALFSLNYYYTVEGIEQILLGKFKISQEARQKTATLEYKRYGTAILIKKEDISNGTVLNKARYTLPSFGATAGVQGGSTALSIK